MSENKTESTTEQAILRAPVVGHLELGSITLPTQEWLQLVVGDVLTCNLAAGRSATIRVAGKVIAWGELVVVDGDIGLQIQGLTPAGDNPLDGV